MISHSRRTVIQSCTVALLMTGFGISAQAADEWPRQPVRLIVSSAPGGGADTVARLVAQHVSAATKQPVIVENRAGASGVLAGNAVLASPADGSTFLFGFTTMAQLPATASAPLPFNVERDFIPVSLVARSFNVLAVSKNTNAKSPAELVAAAKADPKRFSYGSYGTGSTGHFLGARMAETVKAELTHIPYKGAAPMMNDLLGGVVAFGFPDIGSAAPHLASDRIRVLAVTGDKRLPSLPQVPTMTELGLTGFDLGAWFGVFAPKGTPAAAVNGLSARIAAALADADVRARLTGLNLQPVGSTPQEFAAFFSKDMKNWADIARAANIRTD